MGMPTAGQQLVTAADSAIANALEANEKTRQSMARCEAANAAASDPEAALDATSKQRKKRSALYLPVLMQSYALELTGSTRIQAIRGQECYGLQVQRQEMHTSPSPPMVARGSWS